MRSYAKQLDEKKLLILLFHGVIPKNEHPVRNYTAKHITRSYFSAILKDLTDAGGVGLSMANVLALRERNNPWPRRAFAITFDDGFENNFSVAAPILEQMKIPATFYVTTKFVDAGECSWIDRIEYAVEMAAVCKIDYPELKILGTFKSDSEKIELLKQIRAQVKSNKSVDPYEVADEINRQCGAKAMVPDRYLDAKMSWDQVRALQKNPLFTVGGHGHTHRILSYLSGNDLKSELDKSFDLLKKNLASPIEHYSYPEGLKSCYSSAVIDALKHRGIRCCPSAEDGLNTISEDLFELKRVMVN